MEKEEGSFYDKLPLDLLAGFFYQIHKNIKIGILSTAMYHEIKLIEQTAFKRSVSLEYLYEKGSRIVEAE